MTIEERKYQLSLLTNTQQADAIYTLQAQLEESQARVKELEQLIESKECPNS